MKILCFTLVGLLFFKFNHSLGNTISSKIKNKTFCLTMQAINNIEEKNEVELNERFKRSPDPRRGGGGGRSGGGRGGSRSRGGGGGDDENSTIGGLIGFGVGVGVIACVGVVVFICIRCYVKKK